MNKETNNDESIKVTTNSLYNYLLQNKSSSLIMKNLNNIESLCEKELLLDIVDDMTKDKSFNEWGLDDYEIIIKSFKSDDLKFKYLEYISDEFSRYEIIISMISDDWKIKGLDLLNEQYYAVSIIKTFKDDTKKINLLPKYSDYYQELIIESIISDDLLKKLYFRLSRKLQVFVLKSMLDDNFKQKYLKEYNLNEQLQILKTFQDQKLLILILQEKCYQPYIPEFLHIITEQDFLIKLFDSCQYDMYSLRIINQIKDPTIKRSLISRLKNDFYKIALESNYRDRLTEFIDKQKVTEIKFDIDESITIGLELEVCNDDWNTILSLKKILQDWQIVWDVSVINGLEFVSPILKFSPRDMKSLKFLCQTLEDNGFYINDSCGGHLHFGFDYFKSIDEFNVLLNIYGNVEDILYLISNHSKSRIRSRVFKYAKKLKPVLDNVTHLEINFDKCQELGEYVKIIAQGIKTKYYGMNLTNIQTKDKNTIEFRMPNGEINFNEIVLNIRLFAKMLECSKKINNILHGIAKTKHEIKQVELYNRLISTELDERTKVSYLLNILFEDLNERKLYYRRYVNNVSLNPNNSNDKHVLCLKK